MPIMFKYLLVLLTRISFIARNVQRHPITIKITIDVTVAFCAHDTQIPLAWIAWEQTAGFEIYDTVHTALLLLKF